jgi:NAD+ kinase
VLRNVAVLYHPQRQQAVEEARWLRDQLCERGVDAFLGNGWDPEVVNEVCSARDLLVALGGDGTILHVARLAAPHGLPTLGVNLGRVGFLAELTPADLHVRVDALTAGRFWIEERAMLDVEWHGDGTMAQFLCLNEVAVTRGLSAHAVHVNTLLDGEEFMTYTADGVLVATATGSTAYSLAAGGPILYPASTDLMITPVAPHLHIGRSMVIPGTMTVTLRLSSDQPAVMTVDGSVERTLKPDHDVRVCRSAMVARFARLGPRSYFYGAIAARLR